MSDVVLELRDVVRRFRTEAGALTVLDGASMLLRAGEIVALVAPSGTGKSTLLHLAGLLEKPDAGEVFIAGQAAGTLGDDKRTALRRSSIGFVYQSHHLLPEFTAAENVILPQMAAGVPRAQAAARAAELLGRLGLSDVVQACFRRRATRRSQRGHHAQACAGIHRSQPR
ncbi:MAG: ATP-binding cassette domain-containing protein, partial [Alphaproteobacteria bacterium]|nr:ATP-binding cassette domain-containing protein [Alphaproteobacteria bacterium]